MNTQIIIAGLRARPVRTAVGVLAVTLEVVMILLLVGLTNGTIYETGHRVAGVGAEIVLKDTNSSYMLSINSAVIPIAPLTEIILPVEGVEAIAPVVTSMDTGLTMVSGIEPVSFDKVSGGFEFIGKGQMFTKPDEALVDELQASKKNIKVGDTIDILKLKFKVTGIVKNGKMARIFVPIEALQKKNHTDGLATLLYIKLKKGVDTAAAIKRIEKELNDKTFEILDANEWVTLMFSTNASLIGAVFDVVVFLGVTIGVLVIFLSMYTSVSERTREIGILRSMGASKGSIILLVVQESLVLCVIGTIVGIGLSYVLRALLMKAMPTLIIMISGDWVLRAAVFALASGVIGSLYPSYKAASQDPIEALAYE